MTTNPNIEPQTCKSGTEAAIKNYQGTFLAQEKYDGHRAIMYCKDGCNHFYSRRTSEVTGEKEDNTDRLPFFNVLLDLEDTILDGELVVDGDTDSSQVQHILGSTPERARELWESGYKLKYKVFDIIRYKGKDLSDVPLLTRYLVLGTHVAAALPQDLFEVVPYYFDKNAQRFFENEFGDGFPQSNMFIYVNDYDTLCKEIYKRGGEGIVLKDVRSFYEYKRTSKWLKYKQVNTADLVIMGFVPPKKDYTGKFSVSELRETGWPYWEGDVPVSKTYAKGWVAGVKLGAFKDGKLKYVATVKGFSDEVQETIKNTDLCNVVVEVEYQEVINEAKKSLRHPRWKGFRYDKEYTECLWDNVGNS